MAPIVLDAEGPDFARDRIVEVLGLDPSCDQIAVCAGLCGCRLKLVLELLSRLRRLFELSLELCNLRFEFDGECCERCH